MKPQTISAHGEGRMALVPDAPGQPLQLASPPARAGFAARAGAIFQRYGREVRAFLSVRTSSRASMEEVYSAFSEDVWKGLPQLRAHGQLRGWLYVVARNALARHVRAKLRWRSRHVAAELDELQAEPRRSLATRLGERDRLEELLAQLEPEDRFLLEQRSLFAKPWRDIAALRCKQADARELERESARLRKRYQLLLQRLRAGLVKLRNSVSG